LGRSRFAIERRRAARGSPIRGRFRFAYDRGIAVLNKYKRFDGEQSKHVLDMLLHHRIYLSSPSQLNDPFDLAPAVKLSVNVNTHAGRLEYLKLVRKMLMRQIPPIDAHLVESMMGELRTASIPALRQHADTAAGMLLKKLEDNHPIFSLSAVDLHPLLWAHYATHSGLCIHFESRVTRGSPFAYAREVHYSKSRPVLSMPGSPPDVYQVANAIALNKSADWAYEREYRILSNPDYLGEFTRRDGRYAYYDPFAVRGITVGFAMRKADQEMIVEIARRHRPAIRVWRTTMNRTKYQLGKEEIGW
jgi:hypothetical protein